MAGLARGTAKRRLEEWRSFGGLDWLVDAAKRRAGGRTQGSTPSVVPGAAPALAKAGVGGFVYLVLIVYPFI